jgi:hypothetical protein
LAILLLQPGELSVLIEDNSPVAQQKTDETSGPVYSFEMLGSGDANEKSLSFWWDLVQSTPKT